ncbi:hypothetical protein M3Y94_00597400 [Aphelenchoides besseyi]|nr:hypothetical protein M3Y94_00597400 [Aphelenchoides besseyi]
MALLVIVAGIGILVALGLYLYGNGSRKTSEGISTADAVATAKPKTSIEVNSIDAPANSNVVSARTAVSETPTALQTTPSWIAQTQQTTGTANPVATEMTAEQQKGSRREVGKGIGTVGEIEGQS